MLGKRKHNISEATILPIEIQIKLSVDVQTESYIVPCSSLVSHQSFQAQTVLWDIHVINVKSNLFHNISTNEVNPEQSIQSTKRIICRRKGTENSPNRNNNINNITEDEEHKTTEEQS